MRIETGLSPVLALKSRVKGKMHYFVIFKKNVQVIKG